MQTQSGAKVSELENTRLSELGGAPQQSGLMGCPELVGFCGPMGAGKTTAANILKTRGYLGMKMAAPLKAMLKVIGLTDFEIEGGGKEIPTALLCWKTPRYAMQTIGTEWGRDLIGEDFWVRAWSRAVRGQLEKGKLIVCDDIRFQNEADALRALGGKLIEVRRPGAKRSETHVTERVEIEPDAVLNNDGNVEQLILETHRLLRITSDQLSFDLAKASGEMEGSK